jgi:hypothetical protein
LASATHQVKAQARPSFRGAGVAAAREKWLNSDARRVLTRIIQRRKKRLVAFLDKQGLFLTSAMNCSQI